ncbi:hypothetical protein [Flammeovirga aprica]|uniref:Outer membrane protein beta-barrel domain-containing protein n=1 Tax=Flammeovirga aprica JL-4 TaxID=694437 RepID=A0A7X9P0X2_9BACT|nr:hypothetical protein [Flammeovirga aprica]NME67405.1 hypothetical protein [Flammeovirga aprica JL-4]
MKYFLFFLLLSLLSTFSYAQETSPQNDKVHKREEAHGRLKHHRVALMWGHSYVPKGFSGTNNTLIVPTIGLEYEYWFSHHFALGLSNDLELQNYVIETSHGEEFEREYVYIGALMAFVEFAHLWVVGIGPGIEIEHNKNFAVIKASIEREFPIVGKGGWDVTPMLSYELKFRGENGSYDAITFGFAIGKRF